MPTLDIASSITPPAALPTRTITATDLKWALAEGWSDFKAMRGDLLFAGLLYPLLGLIVAVIALRSALFPLLFPLVAGLSIMGPAVASGFYELARRREAGVEFGWSHFFDPLKGRARLPLLVLTLMLAGLFVAWVAVAFAIYRVTLGVAGPASVGDFLAALFGTGAGWIMIIAGNLVGLAFAAVTLLVSVVSFPLVVDKAVGADVAVATSLAAVRRNPGAMVGWGLWIAALLFIGAVPLFIGLAVVLPTLGYATWHLYTRLVER